MTPTEIIKQACVKANPGIKALPTFPDDSNVRKAIIALENMMSIKYIDDHDFKETAAMNIRVYEEERRAAYTRELEQKYPGHPIRLADVLLAQRAWWKQHALKNHYIDNADDEEGLREVLLESDSFEGERLGILENWNLFTDTLDSQSDETITFLANLLSN